MVVESCIFVIKPWSLYVRKDETCVTTHSGSILCSCWNTVAILINLSSYTNLNLLIIDHTKRNGTRIILWVIRVLNINIRLAVWIWLTPWFNTSPIARFMGPTWGPSGAYRTQVGPMNVAIWGVERYGQNHSVQILFVKKLTWNVGITRYIISMIPHKH